MKQKWVLVLALMIFTMPVSYANESGTGFIQAKSYILMDCASGSVLKEANAHNPLPPASMTKMMTALVILDKIKKRECTWQDKVPISARAAKVGQAHVDLKVGKPETLKDLYQAMWVRSANNATVALAEYVASSEERFVDQMNCKAKELGMANTHFNNVTGLEPSMYEDVAQAPKTKGSHVMSAYDAARLCRYLIKTYPEVLPVTSMSRVTMENKRVYPSWNEMLPGFQSFYPGVDGMKTGHTRDAGYCFTSTAKRGHYRLISVVMGTSSKLQRFKETAKLLDEGFHRYSLQTLAEQGSNLGEIRIARGMERTLQIGVKQPLQLAMRKGERNHYTIKVTPKKGLRAPVSQGDVVGKITVLYRGKEIQGFVPVDAIANQSMERENWFILIFRAIGDWVKSWFITT